MNDDQIDDLKQFITDVIYQQTSDIRGDIERLDKKVDNLDQKVDYLDKKVDNLDQKVDYLDKKVDNLDKKVDSLADFVSGSLTTSNDLIDKHHNDHEIRIKQLEAKVA